MRRHRAKSGLATIYAALRERGWEPGERAGWNESAETLDEHFGPIVDCRMKWDNLLLACVLVELLACNQPDTVRGVMYSVVSAGWLPDTSATSYNRVQRLLQRLREGGIAALRGTHLPRRVATSTQFRRIPHGCEVPHNEPTGAGEHA